MFKKFKTFAFVAGIIWLQLFAASCNNYKKITYFKDLQDTSKIIMADANPYQDVQIQSNDVLQVSVQTIDPQASLPMTSTTNPSKLAIPASITDNNIANGYLVDKNGNIELPIVGKIHVSGHSTSEAADIITQKAKEFYNDPIVNVRLVNFKITVLGEVNRPSQYIVPDEKVSIVDAIGLAGDLTIFGKRENILLVRNEGGKRVYARLDLNSSDVFNSPYFYLKQGDIVYVEPERRKAAVNDPTRLRTITVIASAISLLSILASITLR